MTAVLFLGLVFGFSGFAAWRLLFPPAPPLSAAIARLQRRNELTRITSDGQQQNVSEIFSKTLGATVGRLLTGLGLRLDHLEPNLFLVNRSLEHHLGQKVLMSFFGLALPQLIMVTTTLTGSPMGLTLPAVLSLVLCLVFFFLPDLTLRSEANERRDAFRHALGSFLDLVVISLAGGAGVESALRDAATIGRGWSFTQLRNALEGANLTGETPWSALARLGDRLGVNELAELSASVSLAGTEGARVRESLAVKAQSLRQHALAEAESDAQASTERMAVPVVMLFIGFLILIGYPAMFTILGDF